MINTISLQQNRWKSLLLSGIFFVLSSLTFIACAPQETTTAPLLKVLSVGHVPWVGFAAHYVALAKDLYKAEGLNVKDVPFEADTAANAAFLAKRLELNWLALPSTLAFVESNPDTRIIFQSDYSNGADGIVARNITTKESLKGQRIARESSIFTEVQIERYLGKIGVSRSDIKLLDFSAQEAAENFIQGKVNVIVTYEPWLSKAVKEGKGEIVFSTKDSNAVPDGLATREDVIQSYKPELLAYMRAIEKATQLIKDKPEEVAGIVAKALSIKPEEVAGQFALIKLYDAKMNQSIAFNPSDPNSLLESLNFSSQLGQKLKLITKDVDIKSILRDEIVKAIP
jgi:NitT/TauT family transport system substrate-binding protein